MGLYVAIYFKHEKDQVPGHVVEGGDDVPRHLHGPGPALYIYIYTHTPIYIYIYIYIYIHTYVLGVQGCGVLGEPPGL